MGKVAVGTAAVCAGAVCAAAALVVRHRVKNSGKWARAMAILKEFEEKCGTPIGKLRQVADAMAVEMHAGLASEGGSKLKMLISFVDNLPTGYCKLYFILFPFDLPLNFIRSVCSSRFIIIKPLFLLELRKSMNIFLISFRICCFLSSCKGLHKTMKRFSLLFCLYLGS